jgi:hypothetical protein
MGGGSLSWGRVRLILALTALLLLPGTAAAADVSLTLSPAAGVRYGSPLDAGGRLLEGTAPLAGQPVELQGRPYPYEGGFRRLATTTTDARGAFAFERRFARNMQLRAVAPVQGAQSETVRAYVFPRPRSTFKALPGSRLRITQTLRTPINVRLTARTNFYLGPQNARSAPRVARAKPRKIGRGRFRATAVVKLPRRWKGAFRYGSCFGYSEGSGLGDPKVGCPKRYRF